jgi:biopolymer transport protein ExbD
MTDLPGLLANLKAKTREPSVTVSGDEKAMYGRSIAVLDELRRQQISDVSLRTRQK